MNKTIIILLIFSASLIFSSTINAQSSRWKRTRYEIVGGAGLTGFMGDLGGGDATSHFISDFDFASQRFVLQGGLRYKLLEPLAVKSTLSYGLLSGADSKAKDQYRIDRNLSFRSSIIEFATQLEFSIIKEPSSGRYKMRRRKKFSLQNLLRVNTYLFAGVSGFYFNPKGKDDGEGGTGKWVALQPLGTEGQNIMEGREKYKRVSLAFPMGIGFKYAINRKISIGAEFGGRYTLSDYIDDVSTTYVDHDWLASNDPQAARMANKSSVYTYAPGEQRGEAKYNDYYIFSIVTISYKLRTGRNGLPKF